VLKSRRARGRAPLHRKEYLRAEARRLHAIWWFEEAADKKKMIAEWNELYPSAKINLKKIIKEFGNGRWCL